ncbi:MAG: hypothetical protein ACYSO7_10925 [Planctomycetota bacterium]|jgi:hypothetical protein
MLIPEKTKTPRRRFFRKRPHRIRSIAMLPSMITLINGICGFIAIGLAAKGPDYYALAGTMIFYAMIADTLDACRADQQNDLQLRRTTRFHV